MEHKRSLDNAARLGTMFLKEVVEIGIDTEQHLLVALRQERFEHLLALGHIGAVGHRDLEDVVGIIEVVENTAPEGHIFVTLDIDPHQALRRIDGQTIVADRLHFVLGASGVTSIKNHLCHSCRQI